MKKLLLFVLAAMAFVACTQNDVEELTANRQGLPETISVGFEGDDTRIELNEVCKTVWSAGDEASVFYHSNANQRWAFQGETGDRIGTLKRVANAEATAQMTSVVVVYPYNTNYWLNYANGNIEATLPAVQSYKEGSYGADGNIMVAQSEFTQFSLKSVCGWLRVELTGQRHIVNSITLRGNAGEQIAGLIYVDTATAEATLASEMGAASDEDEMGGVGGGLEFDDTIFREVTLDCGSGVMLGAEATAFYIALLPQTFEKGMTIDIDYANAEPQTLVCDSSITIRRNHIAPMNSEVKSVPNPPATELWYTATALVEPYKSSAFNVAIVSNEWDETTGEGVIIFDGELTTIGDQAFAECHSLTSVTIGDSVTTIGEEAFFWCASLTSITIGDSVTTIGDWAFCNCNSLTNVTIPDSVTTIGDEAFFWCSSLTSVTIGNSVTTIGDQAFEYCHSLTSVTIPDSVTTIGYAAFYDCRSLTSVTISDSVTTIGKYAFYSCSSLTSVTIPDSVTTIGDSAFSGCDSLTSVTIGENVTTIGEAAFAVCSNLAEFKGKFAADGGSCLIIDGVFNAFAVGCGVTEYTIPDSVTTIGGSAFLDCSSLTSVTIPDSVTTIGDSAFGWCSSLTSVYCEATTPPTLGGSYVFDSNASGRKIYLPAESVEAYKAAENWSEYAADIVGYDFETGEEVIVVKSELFYTATALVESYDTLAFNVAIVSNEWDETTGEGVIIFDGELTTIGGNAFRDCHRLTSVTIPDSVTTIGDSAFNGCSSLTSVTIPDSVTTIEYKAFYDCDSLTSVTIPDSVTTIGDRAFSYCYSLTGVTIGDSVTTIGDQAFSYCESLTSVTIGNSVTTIGVGVFWNCNSLTSVTIPDSVTMIGAEAFYACNILTSVTIGDSITTIGYNAFYSCNNLTSVYCKATTPPSLDDYVFKYWDESAQEDVNIGCAIYLPAESVEAYKTAENWSDYAADIVAYDFETGEVVAISNKLFYTATALGEPYDTLAFNVAIVSNEWDETTGEGVIIFDGELTTIGGNAFRDCHRLTSVTIPDSVATIGDSAFNGCSSLTSVTIPDSVTTIEYKAFYDCDSLTSVTIPDSVTTIGDRAFSYCYSLTGVTIGDSVTTIGDEAFSYCESLTSVTIGDSVTTIGVGVFWNCNSLTSVTIPDSVTTIGGRAFSNCDSLTSVTIPDSVTTIGEDAFRGCSSLTSVYCEATTPPTLGDSTVFDSNASGRKIYLPAESVEAYKAAENWSEYASSIIAYDFDTGEVVVYSTISYNAWEKITPYAAAFDAEIVSNEWSADTSEGVITFKGRLTVVGDGAFNGCYTLNWVSLPNSITTIGNSAFENCIHLMFTSIPNGVTSIGGGAFAMCEQLVNVSIPDSVTDIGANPFFGCKELSMFYGKFASSDNRSLIVDGVLKSVAPNGLSTYTIPEEVTSIGASAMSRCESLTSVSIHGGVDSIESNAFSYCTNLSSITIPDSVTTIGGHSFTGCSSLEEVTIGANVAAIGKRAFSSCSKLTEVTIPNSTTSIGEYAFGSCSALESISIGEGVLSIGEHAFYGCSSLASVDIPNSVTSIGECAFQNCSNLTDATIGSGVTSIGAFAFFDCTSLTSVYCKPEVPPTLGYTQSLGSHVFAGNGYPRKIYVPAHVLEAYQDAERWSSYAADILAYDFETGEVVDTTPANEL